MKKTIAAAILIVLTQITPVEASPLTVRCSAKASFGNMPIEVQIDIALPEKINKYIKYVFVSRDGKEVEVIEEISVGIGAIEITENAGGGKESHRHKFIVTRMPSDVNSLIGFYTINQYVNSIRVEWWEKTKTFIYFDTYNNEVLRGTCR